MKGSVGIGGMLGVKFVSGCGSLGKNLHGGVVGEWNWVCGE
jgi:hypothetical protein